MCPRFDICYVVSPEIETVLDKVLTEAESASMNFHYYFEQIIAEAEAAEDQGRVELLTTVLDYAVRSDCAPYSAALVNDEQVNPHFSDVTSTLGLTSLGTDLENMQFVFIGNPANPPHEPSQPQINSKRMAEVNQGWDVEDAKRRLKAAMQWGQ